MYKLIIEKGTNISQGEIIRGERIESKVSRMMSNKEPITDGAPLIYEEDEFRMAEGYDIRTDRWDVALSGRDRVEKAKLAKRDGVDTTINNTTDVNNATAGDAA